MEDCTFKNCQLEFLEKYFNVSLLIYFMELSRTVPSKDWLGVVLGEPIIPHTCPHYVSGACLLWLLQRA